MKLVFNSEEVQKQCTDLKAAQKLFGGDKALATKHHARINQLEAANVLKDIVLIRPMRFHALQGDREGYFAIDVKTQKEPWRIIIQPLNEDEEPFNPCNIDEIASVVKIVEVSEVSKHYE